MKKARLLIVALLILILSLTSGCVRGEIILDISRTGSAQLSSKVLVPVFLKNNLTQLKDKFVQDNFEVMDIKENNLEGFHATRKFSNISQMKDVSVFKGLDLQKTLDKPKTNDTNSTVSSEATKKQPVLVVDKGLLFDVYKVDANIDLGSKYDNLKNEENILAKRLLSQIDLKFVLKLPTDTLKTNAHQISKDGQTLTWNLALGENNQVYAEAKMLNMVNVGVLLGLTIVIVGWFVYRKARKN